MSTDTVNSKEVIWEGLTLGPSREELFDATKYGPISSIHPGHCVVEFWLEKRYKDGSKGGSSHEVEIEGLHRGDTQNAMNWFFWGRLRHRTSYGKGWKLAPEWDKGDFVFGRWNAHLRIGQIIFGKKSFFESPLPKI